MYELTSHRRLLSTGVCADATLVSSPCVDHREYPRLHIRLTADFQYHIRCDTAHLCQQPPVVEYQGPVLAGKCEHNMLPRAVGDQAQQILYPLCASLHPAVRTGAAFTPEADLFGVATVR